MLVNAQNLADLRIGFNASFQRGLGQSTSQWSRVATLVPATTKEQKYGWLGKMPGVREWIGARIVHNLEQHDYSIKERRWELTISVDRDDIETDNLGIYGPMFEELGFSTQGHWDTLIFALLKLGFNTVCYDGQYFFDTDHPVLDANGQAQSVANTDGGGGAPWFLAVTKRPLKPLILQRRRDFGLVNMDQLTNPNVFNNNEFVYGSDARANVGFSFWQFCWGSKQTLDATHYETARAAITGMTGDHGRPLGLVPDLLVVPPSLEGAGRALLQSQLVNGGESNKWAGTAELLVVPWLA